MRVNAITGFPRYKQHRVANQTVAVTLKSQRRLIEKQFYKRALLLIGIARFMLLFFDARGECEMNARVYKIGRERGS